MNCVEDNDYNSHKAVYEMLMDLYEFSVTNKTSPWYTLCMGAYD